MSLCRDGMGAKTKGGKVTVVVEDSHPLIQLANLIDWIYPAELAQPDLDKTKKRLWWLGRKLYLRVHLAVMILQMLYKWTDRLTEVRIKTTALFQVFCGLNIIAKWRCPDHTKIEEFRNRLSPETHKAIADYIIKLAISLGFADPSKVDIDSTVQEANMSYPSDATLMKKLALIAYKLLKFLKEEKEAAVSTLEINIKAVVKKFQQYIFMAKNTIKEKKRQVFKEYHILVKAELRAFIQYITGLPPEVIESLPWNYRDAAKLIAGDAWRYLLDVGHFVRTGTIKSGKILALKVRDVVCISKGKIGKDKEFGRVFQLGRIGGNFLIPYLCTSLRMNDKECLPQVIMEHCAIFSETQQVSVSTDKCYYSEYNIDFVEAMTGSADGVQRPVNVKNQVETPQKEELYNRRAGVEPLIGHAKEFGLRKSRMKSDEATLASGYRSVTGFNLHQLMRNLDGFPQGATA